MARRTVTYTVPTKAGNRDTGKTFILTEMSADEGERWAAQALYLMAMGAENATGVKPDSPGMAALAARGLDLASIAELRALMDPSVDEGIWKCVQYLHNPQHPPMAIGIGPESIIEEISTRSALRLEVLKLHLGFSQGAEPQNSAARGPRRAA